MAEYKGKEVKLDDPFRLPQGSDKKFGVYVKNPKSGNVIMVKFGDPNLSIKRDDPDRLKNFRARHNCDQKTDKTTPGYWSCKFWEKGSPVSKLLKQGKVSESDLKFKGKEMKDHLDKAKAKLKAEYGSLDNVDYKKAMKVVGATLAARLSARGMIKRSDGSTKKGKLGKPEEEMLNCGCGCENCKSLKKSINEEKREFVKGWVNPRTKKIIAWRHHTPYHATHIYENLSKYGLTKDDLIDHHIDVVSKRNPKYTLTRERSLERFEKIGYNDMLADRDETIEYPAIKKGWVAFALQETKYGKMMTLRGITKDIKKSGIMVLEKYKTFKDLDRILITNYKDTKFAEYTGKTKNEDERYTSNSEAMKFLFGRRPKRREPKTEIGRTMAMFREERARDYKGWVNPKTGQTRVIQGYTPYHVQMIVKDPRFFGLTEKEIKEALVKKYEPDIDAEFMADEQIGAIKRGTQDVDHTIELLAMEKGMVRFVEGEYGEIAGRKRFNDKELRKILQLIDKETPLTMKPKTTISLQQFRPGRYGDVIIDLYDNIEMNEIKNLIKGRRKGDKQTEIGRTMAMFREWKDKNDEREHNKLFMKSLKVMPKSPQQKKIIQQMNALRKKNGLELLKEEAYLPGQATTSHGGKSGRGGKPGPRMTRQRRHREEVLMHLITNGIKVTNQPSMVTQKGSSDTFAVAKNQVKKAEKILDDFFKKAYIKKSGMRRDNYKIIAESVSEEEKRIAKTRKNQDPDTHSDLYTDENPEGTIHGLGFKDVETAEASVRKIKASDRTHAHKIQAAIAMEQRAKVMKKTAEAAVYRKFIEQMKKKTKEMNEESVELNESFFDFYMGVLMSGGGPMTPAQSAGAMLTLAAIPIGLASMVGYSHIKSKIMSKRQASARKKLDDIIQNDIRVAVFTDWLQEQPYFTKAIDKLEDASEDLKQAYDERDGAAEEIAQKDIQRILSEFGRALKPDWDKFAAKEGFTKLTDKADIGSGISRNLLNRVNKAGRKYNITNYRVYEDVNEDKWSKEYKDSIDCNNPKGFSQRAHCQGRKKNEDKRIPKTRDNQDPDTHSDLYTDEDPRGTIHGLGFKDVETSRASVKKIESSDRTHAHKIQAAIAMEQRAKVMGKKTIAGIFRKGKDSIRKLHKKK